MSAPRRTRPRRKPADEGRRKFLEGAASFSVASAVVCLLAGALRFCVPLPRVKLTSRMVKLGFPSEYPPGTRRIIADGKIALHSTPQGFYAVSTVCTHLGCVLRTSGRNFTCACHGSAFNAKGKVLTGPATRALPWFRVGRGSDGRVFVDPETLVRSGTYVQIG